MTSSDSSHDSDRVAFVIDIDGCLSREGVPIAGSSEALRKLQELGISHVFCTNGGGSLESERAERLSRTFGVDVSGDQVVLSHTPLRTEVVRQFLDSRVLVVGEGCAPVARAYGLSRAEGVREYGERHPSLFPMKRSTSATDQDDKDDPVRAIVVFEDAEDLGEALQISLDVLLTNGNPSGPRVLVDDEESEQEVQVWFTNPDLTYAGLARHPRLTQGSYRLCLETLFESAISSASEKRKERRLKAMTVGKPTRFTGETALGKLLAQCPDGTTQDDITVYTVGDNPYADVALANTSKSLRFCVSAHCYESSCALISRVRIR